MPKCAQKGLLRAALSEGMTERDAKRLAEASALRGEPNEVLNCALKMTVCQSVRAALNELDALCAYLSESVPSVRLRLDYTLVNAEDYYNGIVF